MEKLFLLIAFTTLSLGSATRLSVPGGNYIDYYLLAVQWGPSLKAGASRRFTLHGMWPGDSVIGTSPQYCTRIPLRKSQLKSINGIMTSWCPNLVGRSNFSFWKAEWRKHGVCSALNQFQFFNVAVGLTLQLTIDHDLAMAGVYPGNWYYPSEYINAFHTERGFYAGIMCHGNRLREFRLNFTVDPQPQAQDVISN